MVRIGCDWSVPVRPWSRSKAMVKVSADQKQSFTTTRGMGKHCELNRTASVFNFFRGDKKLVSFRKTKLVNEYYKTHCFLIEKFVVVGKTG